MDVGKINIEECLFQNIFKFLYATHIDLFIIISFRSSNKGRSTNNAAVASGGGQRNFESRILLLRKSGKSNNFDQPLQPGSVVPLGEELVLRAMVQDGDGNKLILFILQT